MTTKENMTNLYIQTKLTEISENADCEGRKYTFIHRLRLEV